MTEFNPFAIFVLVCGAMTVAIANYAWRHRTAFGARPFALFMLALSVYIIGYSMELASTDLAAMLFWNKVEYFGILAFPGLYLVFASEYTDQANKQTPRQVFLLFAIPAVLWFFKIFDETFHLVYATVRVDAGGAIPLLAFTRGPLYMVVSAYNIVLLTLGNYLLLAKWRFASSLYRRQTALILGAAVILYGMYLFYLTGIPIVPSLKTLDINPFGYTIWSLAVGWAIFRHGLFDLAPIARDALLARLSDGVVVMDGQARVVDANPEARRIFGWRELPVDQSVGARMDRWIDPALFSAMEKPVKQEIRLDKEGSPVYYEMMISPLSGNEKQKVGYLVVAHDISERKETEQELRELSLADELTGLNNRRGFTMLADQLIRVALRMKLDALLFYLDLDGLKWINDNLGHAAGDRALVETGELLKKSFRSADILARLGGDEFVVLAIESAENSDPTMLARLEERLQSQNARPGRDYELSLSIGTARFEWEKPSSIESLMDEADKRMYQRKQIKKAGRIHRPLDGPGAAI
ncbi:MAG: diguanylate cyclase [Anaerolineales bacterium]|nr:diguanylate cyclase [Anaerolineales bacterium]